MIRKLIRVAATLALPTLLAAQSPQIPNQNASDTAQVKVARHRQNPQVPAVESSDIAKQMVAAHRATHRRGEVVGGGLDHRPTWIATPPAQRAQPGVSPAVPPAAHPPLPAMPAQPPGKPASPGQSVNHRP